MSAASRPDAGPASNHGSPEQSAGESMAFDRRMFLESAGAWAAALLATFIAPRAGRAADRQVSPHLDPTLRAAERADENTSAEWHVDDMCGHRPRYAHPIPHAPARTSPVLWEHVDPIDYRLVL